MVGPEMNKRCARNLENIGRAIDTVSKVIGDERFAASLDKFLPRPSSDGTPVRKRLRDAQFRQLAEFCNRAGLPQWGLRPRTFAVLRMIGCPETIESFIEERLSDISLPYSEDNLPNFISGQARWNFLDCQNYVLNGRAAALEKPGEPHQHVEGSADDHFMYVEDLGAGGFGEVDSVFGPMSLKQFARKRIKRHRLFSKDKARLQVFENELQTLKSLSHRHLVQLVGSYTDSSCVGLIMTPVADMNLATYLKRELQSESRKICLRRFFGCLSTALSYLHSKRVQHKDIKPENILVKQQTVYLTDFGTSRSWDGETSKTTQGTVLAFTPRYCAPEVVQYGSSRNESRDIWSLGCVFLEMCSVLADQTVQEMSQFMKSNGTHGEYIRENLAGCSAWADRLKSKFTIFYDRHPLDLAIRMCSTDPQRRPSAKELVSVIIDFDSPQRYYGLCCDEQCYSDEYQNELTLDMIYQSAATPNKTQERGEPSNVQNPPVRQSQYQAPAVDDPTEEITVRGFFPPGGISKNYILEDARDLKDEIHDPTALVTNASSVEPPSTCTLLGKQASVPSPNLQSRFQSSAAEERHGEAYVSILQKAKETLLLCPWPLCLQQYTASDQHKLFTHLRESHGTHELFWTALLSTSSAPRAQETADTWFPGQIIMNSSPLDFASTKKAFILKRGASFTTTALDRFTESLRDRLGEKRRNCTGRRNTLRHHEPDEVSAPLRHESSRVPDDLQEMKSRSAPFSLLPFARRPEPLESKWKSDEVLPREEIVISPDPLPEPFIPLKLQQKNGSTELPMPRSSLVPSYLLANANRLPPSAMDRAMPSNILGISALPLFVYGSLMLPSILRAQAAAFISAEGTYSQRLQRRLQTSAEDWSGVNESLQQAAQQMTPALLEGYLRYEILVTRDAGLSSATGDHHRDQRLHTQKRQRACEEDQVPSETKGFLVFGLSHEALACLDYLYSDEFRSTSSTQQASGTKSNRTPSNYNSSTSPENRATLPNIPTFHRKKFEVTIRDAETNLRKVQAWAYIPNSSLQERLIPWDLNRFVKGSNFREWSTSKNGFAYDFIREERLLAVTMGIIYTMVGDEFCDKVLKNDLEGMDRLITEGCDVNASCHNYGTPLQAAAAKGNEEMVYVMMKSLHADPNIGGGRYHSPLVAAISEGHEDVVRTLLKYGANPFAEAGSFISPIYQAVSFGDVEMARLLLEKGAWLNKNYQELLDLAAETGNDDLYATLVTYDIRGLHRRKRLGQANTPVPNLQKHSLRRSNAASLACQSRNIMPALLEALNLKGQKGKWTGIKAVKVLRKAYADDVPENLVVFLGAHLNQIQKILEDLLQGGERERALFEQIKGTGHTETTGSITGDSSSVKPYQRKVHLSQDATRPREATSETEHSEDEIFCLTCGGRGGRKGTGRPCIDCHGTGSNKQRSGDNSKGAPKCRKCNGTGNIFSQRDKCRLCNGGNWRHRELARRHKDDFSEGHEEQEPRPDVARPPSNTKYHKPRYPDPPPPYPGRG